MFFEAPEVFLHGTKTALSDIYSYAMIMYELLYPSYGHPWESVFPSNGIRLKAFTLRIMESVKRGDRPFVREEDLSSYTEVMKMCWAQESGDWPKPTELKLKIQALQVLNFI